MSVKKQLDDLMKEDDTFLSPQDKAKIYLEDNWKQLTAVVIAGFLIVGGVTYYKNNKLREVYRSSSELTEAVSLGKKDKNPLMKFISEENQGNVEVQARLYLASILTEEKDLTKALENYDAVINNTEAPKVLKEFALLGKVYTLINMKKYDDAIQTLKKIKQEKSNFPDFEIDIQMARCYEALGNKSEAVKIYQLLLNDMDAGAKRGTIESKIKLLNMM
ncbi:MAG: tetratricopeptide repeat protein [Nitrospinae bacterium]|nr:tetratricopeptide repeat protein [Nitrospinota bacterium]